MLLQNASHRTWKFHELFYIILHDIQTIFLFSYKRLTFARHKKILNSIFSAFFVCRKAFTQKKFYLAHSIIMQWMRAHNKKWLKFDELRAARRWKLNFNKGANCSVYMYWKLWFHCSCLISLYLFYYICFSSLDILLSWFKVAQVEIDNEVDEHYRKHEMAIQ